MGFGLALLSVTAAAQWTPGEVGTIETGNGPVVALTADELTRLKAAWRGDGPEHAIVAERIARAEEALAEPVVYPPRGGQHNQWYQCEPCQTGLETVDATHHRCPQCGAVYSGHPYDDVLYSRDHGRNIGRALNAGLAWVITGDERFARDGAAILLGYADRYLQYEFHDPGLSNEGVVGGRILSQTLSEASLMATSLGPAYDLIRDSGVLTGEQQRHIRENLFLAMLRAIDQHKAGKGNWQTWHNAAFVVGGAAIGEASWVQLAIDQPGNGFLSQMEESITAEGMWYENSWGYHFYDLQGQVALVEGARRVGVDLWSHPRFQLMFTLPIHYIMPDNTLPRFADSVTITLERYRHLFEAAWAAYREPALLRALTPEPSWESILHGRDTAATAAVDRGFPGSRLFPGAGHALLRTNGAAGLAAALTFSEYGGFHGHLDKLSFVLFGHGEELGYDPGRALSQAYRLPIHWNWYRATISHNTVVVDQKSQEPAGAVCLWSRTDDESFVGVTAETSEAWPGMTHRRSLLLAPEYALVYDHLHGATDTRRFDWFYHNTGHSIGSEVATESIAFSTDDGGFAYIQNALQGRSEGLASIYVSGDSVTTRVLLRTEPGAMITVGDGPGESVLHRIPLCFATTHGTEAVFAAVIEPVKKAEDWTVDSLVVEKRDNDTVVRVLRGEGQDTLVIRPDGSVAFQRDGEPR